MIGRLRQLFRRYAIHHLDLRAKGFALRNETGAVIGQLETIRIARGRLRAAGWVEAERVALVTRAGRFESRPNLLREDIAPALGQSRQKNVGFVVEQPFELAPTTLCAQAGSTRYVYPVPLPGRFGLRLRRLWLAPGFLLRLVRALPAILRWQRTGDLTARSAVKRLLRLTDTTQERIDLPKALFAPAEDDPTDPTPVTLILPVFNAFDLVQAALDRIARHTDLPWHLILVEDGSTDDRIRPFLRDWRAAAEAEAPGRVTLIENAQNLGFIASVNAGFETALARGDHVILINSDALVPEGWATRLVRPILTGNTVASVTPMSNDAEIFSVPVICQKTDLAPGQADRIDAVARKLNPGACLAEAPTGVGFCMALNIDYLRRVPRFDAAFGRGYGEEVDWCQRTRALGGRHLGLGALFVEHRGGSSFGSAQKRKLVARNNAIVSTRYPDYDAEVQSFIRDDPLTGPRLALALAHAAAGQAGPVPIYLAHSLGGGAEKYLERRIARATGAGGSAVVLRVGGPRRWQLELHRAAGTVQGQTDDFALIEALLAPIEDRRIVYSCGVGDADPVTLPARLLALRRRPTDRIEVLFHDFFPISPSYTLLNGAGVFDGVPAAESTDPAHRLARADGPALTLAEWRAAWGPLLQAAGEVVVFSEDSAAHVRAAYPQAAGALCVRPHELLVEVPRIAHIPAGAPVIGVLGNIGLPKGARVLIDLARALGRDPRAGLVLIGNIDPNYALPAPAILHGEYRIEDIPDLVARYGITHWLIPSIWPETFSFTTHEALATGLPVICFDLGAQAEAARAAPNGHVIALAPGSDPAAAVLDNLKDLAREPA